MVSSSSQRRRHLSWAAPRGASPSRHGAGHTRAQAALLGLMITCSRRASGAPASLGAATAQPLARGDLGIHATARGYGSPAVSTRARSPRADSKSPAFPTQVPAFHPWFVQRLPFYTLPPPPPNLMRTPLAGLAFRRGGIQRRGGRHKPGCACHVNARRSVHRGLL